MNNRILIVGILCSTVLVSASAAAKEGKPKMATDRPYLGYSPEVLAKGHWQLEGGLSIAGVYHNTSGDRHYDSKAVEHIPDLSVRFGFHKLAELRVRLPALVIEQAGGNPFGPGDLGFHHLGLGVKLGVDVGRYATLGCAVMWYLPVRPDEIERRGTSVGGRALVGVKLGKAVSLRFNAGFDQTEFWVFVEEFQSNWSAQGLGTAAVDVRLDENTKVYLESANLYDEMRFISLVRGGLIWIVSPSFQLDFSGTSHVYTTREDLWQVNFGASWRL